MDVQRTRKRDYGTTVIEALTGKKFPVWSLSNRCGRTPLMIQAPGAIPEAIVWADVSSACQFKLTMDRLLPGALNRTSKNSCEVRFEPAKFAVKELPTDTFVGSNRMSLTTGAGSCTGGL